jgi:hypothetical protein
MINELLFFLHIALVFGFTLGALKMGKEALIAWTCMQGLLANLFVLKQMECFTLTITCSDVFAVGGIMGLNLLQEYFGKETAKKTAKGCLYLFVFFALMAKMHLWYSPSALDTTQNAYEKILLQAPRILIASLSTFFLVQQIDIRFFNMIKEKFPKAPLALRNTVSLLLSQFLDTVLFSYLGLYGIVDHIMHIIIVSFVIKVAVILSSVSVTTFSQKLLSNPVEPRS